MDPKELLGRWSLAPEEEAKRAELGQHALEFTPTHDLVYTIFAGEPQRLLLTWRLEGDVLVTDQPSHPREEGAPVALVGGRLEFAGTTYVREDRPRDPEARMFGIAGFALRHGVASASEGDAFVPFLVFDDGGRRALERVVADDPAVAEDRARSRAHALPRAVEVCCWVFDGRITLDGEKVDAAIAYASDRRTDRGVRLALPYRHGPDGGVPLGGLVVAGQSESWFD